MQPAYYENLEEIQNKYWSMLNDAVTNRGSPFRIPVFICAHQNEVLELALNTQTFIHTYVVRKNTPKSNE